jgi:hypothetical protein
MLTAEMDAPVAANGHAIDIFRRVGPVPYSERKSRMAKAKAKAKPRAGKAERRSDTVDNDEIDDCAFPPRDASRARPMFEESAACTQMQRTCPRSRSIWMVTREATIQRWTRSSSRLKEPRVPA